MDFVGSEIKDRKSLELLAFRIDPMHRDGEADLMRSRWFDLRDIHPTMATYFYAHCYKVQTRTFYEQVVDIQTSERVRAFAPDDIFKGRDLTAMWIARRAADKLGCPYAWLLRFASDRALNRLYRTFPRPNQMYGEEFELDAADAWQELQARSLQFSKMQAYQALKYRGARRQDEHIAYLVSQVKARHPASHTSLLARCFNEGVLNTHMAQAHGFQEWQVQEALALHCKQHSQSGLTSSL